jgi:predicted nucleic acid-binding protein
LLGLCTESEAARIAGLLDAFDYIMEPTRAEYLEAARIYRICRSKGYTIRSLVDCLIAQICLRDGLPLLCKDRDFQAISQSFSLRLI